MQNKVRAILSESEAVHRRMASSEEFVRSITETATLCCSALRSGKKILLAGNGGSAADAQHLAAELINKFMHTRRAIAAIALTTDTSVITSISNDSSFDMIFSRQIEGIGNKGDILIAISTSGSSPNIISAINTARQKGIIIAGFTGSDKNLMTDLCDIIVQIPSKETPRIQEGHILAGHILCSLIEEGLLQE
jgi:D-sedoheptulose 7-phosphate isomerase